MKIKNLKIKAIITFLILFYTFILFKLEIGCIILNLFNIPCLGCGMTRALIAFLKLDFSEAFSYHFMFWSIPILYISFLNDGNIFSKKIYNKVIHTIILIGFIINWFMNIIKLYI